MIYIAGLGPGDSSLMTIETFSLLRETKVILRTSIHPTVEGLNNWDIQYESLDSFYEKGSDFDSIYSDIANEVIRRYEEYGCDVTYCVPGNPMMAEKSVIDLIKLCEEKNIEYEVKAAMSFVDTLISILHIDPIEGLTILDALDLKEKNLNNENHIIVTQVYNQHVAGEVKINLSKFMDDESIIHFVKAAGVSGEAIIRKIPLYTLDRQKDVDHLTTLFIDKSQIKETFKDFKKTVDTLREPGGCPWDREQTHESLKRYLIEESYEVLDAIDRKDDDHLMEELGDVLLQVLLHSRIKEEEGIFTVDDVIRYVNNKMISRHPHVFKNLDLKDSKEVLDNWEKLKKIEDGKIDLNEKLKTIPKSSPAYIRALETVKKAKAYGIAKPSREEIEESLEKELDNLKKGSNSEGALKEILYLTALLTDSYKLEPETLLNKKVDEKIEELSKK